MRLFGKAGNKSGWLALVLTADGVQAVAIERRTGSQPRVQLAQTYTAPSGYSGSILFRVARDLHAANYYCTTLLGSGAYQLLLVEAPNVPAAEMKAALGWRVKDMIDFPLEEATLDMVMLPPPQNSNMHNSQAYAVVARNSILAPHQQIFWDNKVALDAIDIDEMAQRNISALLEPEGRGVAMLSFDSDGGLLTVSFNGELYLARRMDITLGQLLETEVDRLQHLHDRITLELQRSLDHFERQFSFVTIAKLVLTPVGSGELRNYLAANLYLPVEQLDLASVLDLDDVPDLQQLDQQAAYLRAIGAALRTAEVVA
ncbi:agglutinin biogenesis protein MshI [Pseudoduganella danionis]|uniref:Agglutinin biogenesis protein MshI n=1 Tax=Pseudoduganella danionis TaxID=1890295 RepID=A0ABW9SKL7_9BURK|nr:agglutinin biogenesis protein MshI [Pseudoduganella danionis]MTW32718.1 agglutinin biogenesis protein MshI [Pseudoduganella danionis]